VGAQCLNDEDSFCLYSSELSFLCCSVFACGFLSALLGLFVFLVACKLCREIVRCALLPFIAFGRRFFCSVWLQPGGVGAECARVPDASFFLNLFFLPSALAIM